LTADLFDPVPMDRMTEAERAVRDAADQIPDDVCKRLEIADKLSDEDRAAIVEIARRSLAQFLPPAQSKPPLDSEPASEPGAARKERR
jgi:F-type H+-transporting ATPase subunit alpha